MASQLVEWTHTTWISLPLHTESPLTYILVEWILGTIALWCYGHWKVSPTVLTSFPDSRANFDIEATSCIFTPTPLTCEPVFHMVVRSSLTSFIGIRTLFPSSRVVICLLMSILPSLTNTIMLQMSLLGVRTSHIPHTCSSLADIVPRPIHQVQDPKVSSPAKCVNP